MTTETRSPSQILIQTIRKHHPMSTVRGKYHPVFQSLSQRHSQAQASRNRHDRFYPNYAHAGWGERQIELVSRAPEAKNFGEVCCWVSNPDASKAAEIVFEQWLNSPLHWQMVNGYYDYYGYAMYESHTGVWYATGIVGQKR